MTTAATTDLAACPFCGTAEPEIYPLDRHRTRWVADCGNPGCVTRVEDRYCSEAEAIAAWNRRSPRITRALALLAAVESGAWKCVPVDPCSEMIDAGIMFGNSPNKACIIFQSMLAAAPAAPGVEG